MTSKGWAVGKSVGDDGETLLSFIILEVVGLTRAGAISSSDMLSTRDNAHAPFERRSSQVVE